MIGREIRERARRIADRFAREADRTHGPMAHLLACMRGVASYVADGEYHRERLFLDMVTDLGSLGFDMSGVDTGARHRSMTTGEAAWNAGRDIRDLWRATADQIRRNPRAHEVVNRADDLMQTIDGDTRWGTLEACAEWLDLAVTEWVRGDGEAVTGECERLEADGIVLSGFSLFGPASAPARETPERVLFNPPATIAFWDDGTKTVAKCSKGDEFSEYVGLLVCIAKRHLKIPRRGTFEDAMAKLLKRAERQGGAHREP